MKRRNHDDDDNEAGVDIVMGHSLQQQIAGLKEGKGKEETRQGKGCAGVLAADTGRRGCMEGRATRTESSRPAPNPCFLVRRICSLALWAVPGRA